MFFGGVWFKHGERLYFISSSADDILAEVALVGDIDDVVHWLQQLAICFSILDASAPSRFSFCLVHSFIRWYLKVFPGTALTIKVLQCAPYEYNLEPTSCNSSMETTCNKRKKDSPASSRCLSTLKHADDVESLLPRQGVNGNGPGRPRADDGNPLDCAHFSNNYSFCPIWFTVFITGNTEGIRNLEIKKEKGTGYAQVNAREVRMLSLF